MSKITRVTNQEAPREWWIGRTESGFDKWLTPKSPEETECRNVFIASDGREKCVEYIAVIEKSAYDAIKDKPCECECVACSTHRNYEKL